MLRKLSAGGLLAIGILLAPGVQAQEHDHEGDIAVYAQNGQLAVRGPYQLTDAVYGGYKLYEAEFGDQFVFYQTANPGFQTQGGDTLQPGAIISFAGLQTAGLGALGYWNGSAWSAAGSGDFVTIRDAATALTTFDASGVTPGATSYVAQVSAAGGIHSHLPFATNPSGTEGAYLIQLQLTSSAYGSSDPFYIAFNYGLDHSAYEAAVGALVTAVPEPAAATLMLLGIGGLAGLRRQRTAHARASSPADPALA